MYYLLHTISFKVQLFGVELSDGGNIVDLTHIAPNTLDFISAGDSARNVATQYLSNNPPSIARAEVKLAAPINRMDKVRFGVWSIYGHYS